MPAIFFYTIITGILCGFKLRDEEQLNANIRSHERYPYITPCTMLVGSFSSRNIITLRKTTYAYSMRPATLETQGNTSVPKFAVQEVRKPEKKPPTS